MADNLTIKKLLDNDHLKQLADKIISEDIDSLIIIYRDKTDSNMHWDTTIDTYAELFGSLRMADDLIYEEWHGGDKE